MHSRIGSTDCAGRADLELGSLCALAVPVAASAQEPAAFQKLGTEFTREIRPILDAHCMECHATDVQEGTLDLEKFAKFDDVRGSTKTWLKVAEMLDNGEMPPKTARQPSAERRKRLRNWVGEYLRAEALASAGDPGPVVLRRLGNAEYTYTLLDLTGIDLQPAREFPVDGAAGEGFTNAGNALVMSPALLSKYLDAGKKVASHAVLLPDGIRFSPGSTRRDWTDEALARIRGFYSRFTDPRGGSQVNLQGIVFGTNEGGRLPLEKYLRATIRERDALAAGAKDIANVAKAEGLNARYLGTLWQTMCAADGSPLFEGVRAHWRSARPDDAPAIAAEIAAWQKALWRFSSVGHIGKVGGPTAWMEPLSPLVSQRELRLKLPAAAAGEITVSMVAGDAGDGNEHDFVVWEQPRLVAPGRPDLLLRDVRTVARQLANLRERAFGAAAVCLDAASEAARAEGPVDLPELARRRGVDPSVLAAWFEFLGIGTGGKAVKIATPLTGKIKNASGHDFVTGWGSAETPSVVANSSGQHVRIPGNLKPHGVAVHPSPTLAVAVGWQSPVTAVLRAQGRVQHAHPECGNGVTWSLELRRGAVRQTLAAGVAQGAKEQSAGPIDDLAVEPGDLISLVVGPRDGNHACDLTAIDLTLKGGGFEWDLAREVSPEPLAGNPHADAHGHPGVWHFYSEPDKTGQAGSVIPAGSLLARWQRAATSDEKHRLAQALADLLKTGRPASEETPDALLYRQLASLRGPLVNASRRQPSEPAPAGSAPEASLPKIGLDPSVFGKHPRGGAIDAASLCVQAPSVFELQLPGDLVAGCELVATVARSMRAQAATAASSCSCLPATSNRPTGSGPISPSSSATQPQPGAASNWRSRRFAACFHRLSATPRSCRSTRR